MKTIQVTRKVFNFFIDNKRDIFEGLVRNFLYAFCMVMVPVALFSQNKIFILMGLMLGYGMFTVVLSAPKYETWVGKLLMWFSLVGGGFCSYLFGEFIKTTILC